MEAGGRQGATLTTLEESVWLLWARQPPAASESEFTGEIHVVNTENQNTPSDSNGSSIDPNYKPSFKQVFDPKTSTIAAFLTIYETAMRRATDKLKKEHILTCLHPVCQEVVVYN